VTAAPQLDLVDRSLASETARVDVMEFQETALVASMAAGPGVLAAPEVPDPYRALDAGCRLALARLVATRGAWVCRGGELVLGQFDQQCREGAIEDSGLAA